MQVLPIMALDKKYEGFLVPEFLKLCYKNWKYVETDDSLKNQGYYEFILTDTDSLQIKHKLENINDPKSIKYSRFTIKGILSLFEWYVDHLHTPITLSRNYQPQTYNWYKPRKSSSSIQSHVSCNKGS